LEKCLADVARCDVYIGLFAWRYGFVPPGYTQSITELEYREAARLGKPCLIFLLAEDAAWRRTLIDGGEAGERIEALRAELAAAHICSFFTGPDDLATLVTAALAYYRNGNPLPPTPADRPTATTEVLGEETRQNYFERLRQSYTGVELDALTPAPTTEFLRIGLTSVFVEPTAREDARPELPRSMGTVPASDGVTGLDVARLRASYEAKPSAALFDLLTDPTHRTIVLLGDPGAGKSAVTRYVALALAGVHTERKLESLYGHLPLLIELRSYIGLVDDGKAESFLDYLDHRFRTDSLGLPAAELLPYLESDRPALVLFDGLDEVFEPHRREDVARRIAAFAAQFPAVRVLVTARVVGYSRRCLTDAGFDHFTLEDFDEEQIAAFLSRWYELAIPGQPTEAQALRRRMLSAIRNSPAIRDLAGNPLLLTILAIIGKDQDLPKERWRLYDHAANVLVEYWDADRHLRQHHGDVDFLDTNDKKKLLRRLAFRMQSQHSGLHGNYIDHEQLSRLFEDYLVDRYEHPRARAHALANSMIDQFHQRNFILGRYGQRVYGFVHRTFLEFFCAQSIVGKFHQGDPEWPMERLKALFAEHWAEPSWREVLRLVAGALDAPLAGELIRLLATEVNRPWPADAFAEPPWNLALAAQCLAEVRDLDRLRDAAECLLRQLILLVEHGVSIEDRNTAELIEAEILPAVRVVGTNWPGRQVYLHWYRRRGIRISGGSAFAARVAVLLATPHEGIEDLLYKTLGASGDRRELLALIAGLSESVGLPVGTNPRLTQGRRTRCRALLVERARTDTHGAVRLAALEALVAQFGLEDAALRDLLHERAREDAYPAVRLMAVQTLGGRRGIDDATRTLLIELAYDNRDNPVRRSAVEALARRYTGHGQIRDLLLDRLRADTDVGVLQAAARAILDRPGGAGLIRDLLLDRVREEPQDAVRRCAVRLLGNHLHDDEVRELLHERVRDDNDPGTRTVALQVLIDTIDGSALRELLTERIRADDDADLRLLAQRTLVEKYRTEPGTVRLLAAQARTDRDATVRRAAVADLAEHFADEETAALLADLARTDPAAGVRLAAADALAEHFGADARTRDLIIEQAANERDTIVRLAATRTLIKLDADSDHLLDRVHDDPDPQVIREAAQALIGWPGHRAAVYTALRERANRDSYAGVRLAAIGLLVNSNDTDPVLGALFVDRARKDPDPAVFRTAVLALVERFGGGEPVEQLLLDRADSDDGAIRLPAIEVLAAHFGSHAHVRALLIDRARNDSDVQVRRAAVHGLGDELAGHQEVRALLRELIHDPDWSVRRTAVHALGRHFEDDDDLRSLFMDRACNDPNPEFRRVAGQALTWLPGADPDQLPDVADSAA
jgi:HEAT repeat protein